MKAKVIWLINQYASTPETGMGGRQYYLANELAKKGYKVYVIASLYTHLLREPKVTSDSFILEDISENFKFLWLKSVHYNEANDKKRILNWFKFTFELAKIQRIVSEKPDVILYSSPSVIPYLSALYLSKKFKVNLVWDIRDLWPLTLVELGGTSKKHPFIVFHQLLEKLACRTSDYIISNWPLAIKHLEKHGADKKLFKWIPNGFCKEEFGSIEPLPTTILESLPVNKFVIGYAGTLGQANAIQSILDTALLSKDDKNLHYVIVGRGRLEQDIIDFIKANNLSNITLIGAIPKKYIPAMLKTFNVCYVGFNKSNLYQYGSSLNKLPEYLMSGRPIIYAIDSPFKPVTDAKAGITVPAENPLAVFQAIKELQLMSPKEREQLGANGVHAAMTTYEYGVLADQLLEVMFTEND